MTRIMIVEDDANTLHVLDRLLSKNSSFQVEPFIDSEYALEHLKKNHFDIIISDYRMPTIDGIRLLEASRETLPYAARILVSGQADTSTLTQAVNNCRIDSYISKPWDNNELLSIIESTAEKQKKIHSERSIIEFFHNKNHALSLAIFSEKTRELTLLNNCNTLKKSCLEIIFDSLKESLFAIDFDIESYSSAIREEIGHHNPPKKNTIEFGRFDYSIGENNKKICREDIKFACNAIFDDAIIRQQNPLYGEWEDLFMMALYPERKRGMLERAMSNLNQRLVGRGIKSGKFISHIENKRHTIIFFNTMKNKNKPIENHDITTICELIHQCNRAINTAFKCPTCRKVIAQNDNRLCILTDKQKDILESFLRSPDATLKSVAKARNVSIDAINFHLRNIRSLMKMPRASPHAMAMLAKDMGIIQ